MHALEITKRTIALITCSRRYCLLNLQKFPVNELTNISRNLVTYMRSAVCGV